MPTMNGFRVTQNDYLRIKEYADRSNRSLSDIFRTAVLEYIEKTEDIEDDSYFLRRMAERDKQIVSALKAIENRFATLLVRLGIDLNFMVVMNSATLEEDDDKKKAAFFDRCHEEAVKRFRRTVKPLEKEITEALKGQGQALAASAGGSRFDAEKEPPKGKQVGQKKSDGKKS